MVIFRQGIHNILRYAGRQLKNKTVKVNTKSRRILPNWDLIASNTRYHPSEKFNLSPVKKDAFSPNEFPPLIQDLC